MSTRRLELLLLLILVLTAVVAISLGESPLSAAQYHQALTQPGSPPGEVLWAIRLPRVVMAALTGAGLGLAGAAMQGLLRNPLASVADVCFRAGFNNTAYFQKLFKQKSSNK